MVRTLLPNYAYRAISSSPENRVAHGRGRSVAGKHHLPVPGTKKFFTGNTVETIRVNDGVETWTIRSDNRDESRIAVSEDRVVSMDRTILWERIKSFGISGTISYILTGVFARVRSCTAFL